MEKRVAGMAETAASILGPVVTEAVKWVGAAIKRQFYYLCCFTTIITTLKEEVEELEATAQDLQGKVERARDEGRVSTRTVETWLAKSEVIKDETHGILKEVLEVENGCLKLRARFSLSRRAKKTTDRLKELRVQCSIFDTDAISEPGPSAATKAIPLGDTYEFGSRKQIEEEIMKTLVSGDVNTMGICGMGGLGKTVMAKRIMNKALEIKAFDEVVIAVVSQPLDKSRVQLEIGGSLGLKLEGESWQVRVQKLHRRLTGAKRILLVLDDVWEKFGLEDLGIPCNHEGCKIIVTSRNSDVVKAMNVQKIFAMEVLSNDDAWFLFRSGVGKCVDDNTKLNSIAKDVVNECKGLPIALATVGAALKDETRMAIWKDRRRQLRNCDPSIPGFLKDVYNPLKLSYDALDSNHQYVFLLCCLYHEDAHIPVEDLAYFCMGLDLFEGITTLEEARNNMCSLTDMLKRRHLLLHSEGGDDYVRMHDVVRDVCIFIAKQKKCIGGNDCAWISSSHRSELPTTSVAFPNLRLLFLSWIRNSEFKFNNSFLEGLKELSVLYIEDLSLTSLSFTTRSLKNLNTLVLVACNKLKTLSVVGELVNLEILICFDCDLIEELPQEMKELNRLKLLDVHGCINLKRIGRGIISSLVGLEELKMWRSFKKWEAEDREDKENAGLRELEALTNLRWLKIDIEDPALARENFHLSSKLDKFVIKVGDNFHHRGSFRSSKRLYLRMEKEIKLGPWIEMQLLPNTECLILRGNGANNMDLAKTQNIKLLDLGECETWVRSSMDKIWNGDMNLKELYLNDLPALKHFENDCFPHLEVLSIRNCKMMEQVFLWMGESQSSHPITKTFPKMKCIRLCDMSNLNTFYKGIEDIEFPRLRILDIQKCKKLTSIISKRTESNENIAHIQDLSSQPLEVSFGCLEDLTTDWNPFRNRKIYTSFFNGLKEFELCGYEGSTSFITSSVVGNLVNITRLTIKECDEMTHVITNDEKKDTSGDQSTILQFPKLEKLILSSSPKLVSFCEWKCDMELPSLRKVKIDCCRNMKNLTMGSLNAPLLEYLDTDTDNYLLLQVPFNSMKKLKIQSSENPLNCDKIDPSHFNVLGDLTISNYNGSMSFFPSSITRSLINLTSLTIEGCRAMVKVIGDNEDKDEVGSHGERTSLFPKLQELRLYSLPKLVSFCEWNCDVELSSLTEVNIRECSSMKRCTLGHVATPKLQIVRINGQHFDGIQDLNGLLQQVLEERKQKEEKEKGDGESQERKGEIVEEQN